MARYTAGRCAFSRHVAMRLPIQHFTIDMCLSCFLPCPCKQANLASAHLMPGWGLNARVGAESHSLQEGQHGERPCELMSSWLPFQLEGGNVGPPDQVEAVAYSLGA